MSVGHPVGASEKNIGKSVGIALVAACLFAGAIYFLVRWTSKDGDRQPEIELSIVFIVGVLAILLALGALAIALRSSGLADPKMPMGLPDGSMRALISLLIVVLFFIIAVFVFRELLSAAEPRSFEQLTQAQADAIPLESQVSRVRSGGTAEAPTFNVTVAQQIDESVKTYAVQLLATVSTLVVAVSAFYFGTSSATTAIAAANMNANANEERVLRKIEDIEKARADTAAASVPSTAALVRIAHALSRR